MIQLIDSHCHLNLIDLSSFDDSLDNVIQQAREAGVSKFLCVCVTLDDVPTLQAIADKYSDVVISVGVHPNDKVNEPVSVETLISLSQSEQCIAIGETGLDFYRTEGADNIAIQKDMFANHIQASKQLRKPLIIHTRQAAKDTIDIMTAEQADDIGGVMHCFAEDWDIAQQSLDLNFYISFSGIVTFKSAKVLQDVAQKVPLDRMLIETDSPYLAPTPHRGKQNHPALVVHVAEMVANLRGISVEEVAQATSENFYRCFQYTP